MFTRQHFESIAAQIRELHRDPDPVPIAKAFADAFAKDNPRFDRAKFLRACGVKDA